VKTCPALLVAALSLCAPGHVFAQRSTSPTPPPNYDHWQEFLDDSLRSTLWWVEVAGAGAIDQVSSQPPEWEGGSGYAKRNGSDFVKLFSSEAIDSAVGAVMHQRVSYDRCTCTGSARLGHALSRVFVGVSNEDGHLAPNVPLWIAIVASSALAMAWMPPSYKAHDVMVGSGIAFGAAAGIKVFKEFIHVS
jgi:hypothetical protein